MAARKYSCILGIHFGLLGWRSLGGSHLAGIEQADYFLGHLSVLVERAGEDLVQRQVALQSRCTAWRRGGGGSAARQRDLATGVLGGVPSFNGEERSEQSVNLGI